MATLYWLGTAAAVSQSGTFTVTAYDAATTYAVIIGGVTVSVVGSGGTTTTVATALTTALNASTHPYFAAITWSSNAAVITGTTDTAGVPFTATSSETGGTGTIGDYAAVTASSGPNDWSTAANWSTGAVPVNADTVYIKDSEQSICWGLAQSAVALTAFYIHKSFTGRIGLHWEVFATNSEGSAHSAAVIEYRADYLAISTTTLLIGEHFNTADLLLGSGRIKINLGTTACTAEILGTAENPYDGGNSAVRLRANSATTDIFVRYAPGGVSVAADIAGETTTARKVSISDTSLRTKVQTGAGLTLTTWEQDGGVNLLRAAATITTVTIRGGVLTSEGAWTATTATISSGLFVQNNVNSGSAATIGTLNINGGIVDATGNNRARTITNLNLSSYGALKANGGVITVTTPVLPTGKYTLTATPIL